MRSLLSSSATNLLASSTSLLVGVLCSIFIARYLGAHGTGQVAFALWIATAASDIADRGGTAMLLRYARSGSNGDRPIKNLMAAVLRRSTVPALLIFLGFLGYAAWHGSQQSFEDVALWALTGAYFLAFLVAAFAMSADWSLFRFVDSARSTLIGCLFQLPAVIAGTLVFGAAGAMFGYVLRYVPQALRARIHLKDRRESAPQAIPAPVLRHGRNEWISSILGIVIWSRAEFLALGYFGGARDIGYYAVGLTFVSPLLQLTMHQLASVTPFFSQHHDNRDIAKLADLNNRVHLWACVIVLPVCFGGMAIMPVLLPLVFGSDFANAVPVSMILLGSAAATCIGHVATTLIIARERTDFLLSSSLAAAVLMAVLLVLLVPMFDAVGAAWARTGVHVVWMIAMAIFSARVLGCPIDWRSTLKLMVAAAICGLAAYAIVSLRPDLLGVVFAVIVGALVYGAAIRVARLLPPEDLDTLAEKLLPRLPRRLRKGTGQLIALLRPAS